MFFICNIFLLRAIPVITDKNGRNWIIGKAI